MSPARKKKQRAEDRDQGFLDNKGQVRLKQALTKKKTDPAHWKQGKLLGVDRKIDVSGTNSNDPATTVRADRKRMEAVERKQNKQG